MKSRLDKYLKVKKLGEGTYGIVYKAQGIQSTPIFILQRQENKENVRSKENSSRTRKWRNSQHSNKGNCIIEGTSKAQTP